MTDQPQRTVRAIPTTYNGIDFRSRLEARWAIWLDYLDITWEYEPEGFEDMSDGLRYLPDFLLIKANCYLEIKPQEPSAEEVRKAWLPVKATDRDLYICHGDPPDAAANEAAMYRGFHLELNPVPGCDRAYVQSIGAQWTRCPECGAARPTYSGMTENLNCCAKNPGHSGVNFLADNMLNAAYRASKRADFRWEPKVQHGLA